MFQRVDKLLIDLPRVEYGDANAASAVQELLGGKFGEMSTLNNYMYQSFNFRGRKKLKPFYDLVASITAEEFGHVELVSNTINLLNKNSSFTGDPNSSPLQDAIDKRNTYAFIANAQTSLAGDSMGNPWRGDYVFSSGNLVLDLLHNFFLECGARTHKMRVYEMTDHPTAREMIGYLLVRGGTHVLAYAKAIEIATGVDVTKMLPIPNLDNRVFDTARKYEEQGYGNVLFTWNNVGDYKDINQIWKGNNPMSGEKLVVKEGSPKGYDIPDLRSLPEEFAPGIGPDEYEAIAKRLMANM
ncbi:Mn-containing catalase (includes spore coat protein CotJC) [Psychrobacillus psychrotolerans]|uniref:Mn-containing catalase (Includes spore coat protein CotJC) n=1 Tax=Psychrobacillus psychrotolerans TaxID=126156 RepID=A0A1I5VM17_9BACI|nr:manganese catalase family protein [Psychrobacillus psychrotolerans]SFQ08337.1 Mn-containing catalase (includes spore coat protein CotJC) [Psychrobacillus psychrotolerans]